MKTIDIEIAKQRAERFQSLKHPIYQKAAEKYTMLYLEMVEKKKQIEHEQVNREFKMFFRLAALITFLLLSGIYFSVTYAEQIDNFFTKLISKLL